MELLLLKMIPILLQMIHCFLLLLALFVEKRSGCGRLLEIGCEVGHEWIKVRSMEYRM